MMKLLVSSVSRTKHSYDAFRKSRYAGVANQVRTAVNKSGQRFGSNPISFEQRLRAEGPARTRFAPSPTGYLHLGSLRTALFNYLIAKATGGQFLLRIEDTDQSRTVADAERRLYEDLEWAGIEWDEGPKIGGPYGPYRQSERLPLYREYTEKLLESGHAYRCFCAPTRLRELAELKKKHGIPPSYDRTCSHISKEESDDKASKNDAYVVRLKADSIYPQYKDLIFRKQGGVKIHKSDKEFDDPILMKTDGFPTYHLANVVDDHLMNITHVVRGSEWLNSTPMHIALYQAFGWQEPKFAHISLLVDKDNQKLSKRVQSANIRTLREEGILPEALTNFVALLGWSHDKKSDLLSMQELIDIWSLRFTRGDTKVTFNKLWHLQKKHALRYLEAPAYQREASLRTIIEHVVKPIVSRCDAAAITSPEEYSFYTSIEKGLPRQKYITKMVRPIIASRQYATPQEFISKNPFFFTAPNRERLEEHMPSMKLHEVPSVVLQDFSALTVVGSLKAFTNVKNKDWNIVKLAELRKDLIDVAAMTTMQSFKSGDRTPEWQLTINKAWGRLIHASLRWAILGGMKGPDGSEVMSALGKDECLRRLASAVEILNEKNDSAKENDAGGSLDNSMIACATMDARAAGDVEKVMREKLDTEKDEDEEFGSLDG
ncbi:hypothetical protein BJ878DRAFT_495861 [Calycina marina]|uniref:Glutamate--tRNA ligase, mitochondrial n=1 Tax=Calycina marina TaxID=1763456 RepID=A0A9P7Z7W8_9HELO|nr:hypothetical protein BJ878DRAFT_495861 [Calycina marina]